MEQTFTYHQFKYLWLGVIDRYEAIIQSRGFALRRDPKELKPGKVPLFSVVNREGETVAHELNGYGTTGRGAYSGLNCLPKPSFDNKEQPILPVHSMMAVISEELRNKQLKLAFDYLNPYADLYERLRSADLGRPLTLRQDKAQAYARFCGFDILDELLQSARQGHRIDTYRAFFFSHIRYEVYEKGVLEIDYTLQTVEVTGFYQNAEISFAGPYERHGNNLFVHLKNSDGSNHFMLMAKVQPHTQDFGGTIKATLSTVSSYARQFLAATEVLLVREANLTAQLQASIQRYFMLRRTRYIVTAAEGDHRDFRIEPLNIDANVLAGLVGNYIGLCRLANGRLAVFHCSVGSYYKTLLKVRVDESGPLFQVAHLELSQLSLEHFIWVRGYEASARYETGAEGALPEIGQLRTLLQLHKVGPTFQGEMSVATASGLQSGKALLVRSERQAEFPVGLVELADARPMLERLAEYSGEAKKYIVALVDGSIIQSFQG